MRGDDVVGREAELERLAGYFERAMQGHTSICMVSGEPGAGKTTLLRQFSHRCRLDCPDLRVAYGECDAVGEAGDPYLPFREILQDLTGESGRAGEDVPGSAKADSRLGRLFRYSAQTIVENGPDLIDIFVPGAALAARLGGRAARKLNLGGMLADGDAGESVPTAAEVTQESIFEQYVQVLRALATQRPLILIVDDLHWADSGSVGLLFHLARRLVSDPILIIGAYRDEDVSRGRGRDSHALVPVLAELRRIHGDVGIDLGLNDARGFVDAFLDARPNALDTEFRDELTRHTDGNPLFLTELLNSFIESGALVEDREGVLHLVRSIIWRELPHRVEGVIESRMQRLSAEQREILDVACVQGEEFSAEIVAAITGQTRRTIVRELSGSLQREHRIVEAVGLVRIGSRSRSVYRFRHNLFQAYLYETLDQIERADLHGETGIALEGLHEGEEEEVAVALARHFSMTPDWERRLRFTLMAAERARRSSAPREAAGLYESALEILSDEPGAGTVGDLDPGRIAELLAIQHGLLAEQEQAIRAFERALEATPADDHLRRARLLTGLSEPLQRLSRYDEANDVLDVAASELDAIERNHDHDYWRARLEILLQRGYIHYWRGDIDQLEPLIAELRPLVEQWADVSQRCEFGASMLRLGLRKTRFRLEKETVDLVQRAVDDLGEEGPPQIRMSQLFQLGFANLWSDRPAEAAASFKACLALYPRCGDEVLRLRALVYLAYALRMQGDAEQLERCVAEAEPLAERSGSGEYGGALLAHRAWLAWRAGDDSRAHALSQQALGIWEEKAPRYPAKWAALMLRLRLMFAGDDIETAVVSARELTRPPQARLPAELEASVHAAIRAWDEDRPRECREALATALELAERLNYL
jgi:tetratricopeptide (TPR) repeat protein